MSLILFTFGLFLKTVYISYKDYRKHDVVTILSALACAVFIAFSAHVEAEPGDKTALVVLPLMYVFAIAFTGFKSRLLPVVTESTMLIYGLIGTYFYIQFGLHNGVMDSELYFYGACLFLLYLGVAVALTTSTLRLSKLFQAICMTMFIVMSIYISLQMLPKTVIEVHPVWAVVMGFSCLSLVANFFYLLYFIPITAKGQTIRDRLSDIGKHLSDFERNYYDDDTSKWDLLLITFLIIIVLFLELFTTMEAFVIVAIVLSLVELIQRQRRKEQLVEFKS